MCEIVLFSTNEVPNGFKQQLVALKGCICCAYSFECNTYDMLFCSGYFLIFAFLEYVTMPRVMKNFDCCFLSKFVWSCFKCSHMSLKGIFAIVWTVFLFKPKRLFYACLDGQNHVDGCLLRNQYPYALIIFSYWILIADHIWLETTRACNWMKIYTSLFHPIFVWCLTSVSSSFTRLIIGYSITGI